MSILLKILRIVRDKIKKAKSFYYRYRVKRNAKSFGNNLKVNGFSMVNNKTIIE